LHLNRSGKLERKFAMDDMLSFESTGNSSAVLCKSPMARFGKQ